MPFFQSGRKTLFEFIYIFTIGKIMIESVLLICQRDWANHAYLMQECLRSVGIDAKAVTTHANKRTYIKQAYLCNSQFEVDIFFKDYDIIIFMHSQFISTTVDISKKKILVMHTGTTYRRRTKEILRMFNPIVDVSLTAGDLYGKGCKNEKYIVVPIDITLIKPKLEKNKKLVFAHYPSGYKGGDIICRVMEKFPEVSFNYDSTVVPWDEQIKRMSECDVYIEDCKEKQYGRYRSGFGVTGLEAAALGKLLVSRVTYLDIYEKIIGKAGVIVANNEIELKRIVKDILSWSDSALDQKRKKCREWIEKYHSFTAVGESLISIFKEIRT
jgi:glycosyltransferase involved in cell wall biosynthesis